MAHADQTPTVAGGVPGTPRQRRPGEAPDDRPAPDLLDLTALETRARELLAPDVADFFAGGAESETTLREAPAAWRSWRLRPRVLRGEPAPSLGTSLLGSEVATPVGVAPWAYQTMAHADGERGTAEGAAAAGALMTVSTSASTELAELTAVAPDAPKFFQLYRVHSPAHTEDVARRAGAAGYRALVLTVDMPVFGRRLRDLVSGFALPADLPLANRPAAGHPAAPTPAWAFDDIGRFADLSGLPVVVKGVLRGDDAARCVQAGAAAVWVSNHGGRQADPAVATAHALPEVVDAVGDEVEVYVDGGIRSGSDVLTALALGARAVFVGRPAVWGLATGGRQGVTRVLSGLTAELAHTMALCGVDDVTAVPRDTIAAAR
ncbi:alpha-hydroxy-acid oxidizing protein [Geodermatophilus sabuli]|uniref:Alpha-hydroxy-acid oxidizing protein n=1 Tax=Geodermatophilus sabuli TaxID=1564158 RepID=A0A7K3W912_9ACTN|nr:alpha-hydroxy acid oxidase [Geodermatophilus sabuli]NEK60387.1 alpha-hydroxy-acid oxidizing protein [Geodermatophilus sabuli]